MRTDRKCAVELNCAERNRRNRSHFSQSRSIVFSSSKGDKKFLEFYICINYIGRMSGQILLLIFVILMKSFLMYVFILIFFFFLHQLFFVCPPLCFLHLLSRRTLCRKGLCTIVFLCFVALVSTFP